MLGYLIIKVLNIEDEFNLTEKIVYSFTFGIAFTIVSYFIFYLMSFRSGLYIFGPILSTVAIILSIKKIMRIGINNLKIFQKIDYRLMFIMLLLLMFSFAGVSLTNLPPDITGITIIYEDLLWIIGNTDSLMRSFPVFDSRFAGLDFKYHYFVFIFRAVTSLITKISSERLFFVYSQFIMIPYLVLSLYIFAQTVFNNARKSRFFVWLFLFTGCASMYCLLFNWIGFFFNVTIIDLVIFPNGLDLATPTILLLTNVLIKYTGKIAVEWVKLLLWQY